MEQIPNIRHLAAFAATVDHGTATRAAQKINLTQPALTQAIARLESDLGCQLFEREPGGMKPTEPAVLLAPRAQRALDLIGSNRVTSTQIRAFLSLVRAGSYSSGAERIGLSAASLHRAVGDLSVALGERLTERRGRHMMLTRQGQERARRFGLAIAELRSGYAEVAAWLGKQGGKIVIGAMPLSRARWLPSAIVSLRNERPDIELEVVEGSHGELVGPLRHGDVDFLLGALRENEALEDLVQQPVFEDRPQIVMRKGHPLLHRPEITAHSLRECEWVLPGAQTPLRNYWQEMFEQAGTEPPPVRIECGSVLTIRELLLETDMVSLLSTDQLRVEIEAGLLHNVAPPVPVIRTIGITSRKDWQPTFAQQAMLDTLERLSP